VHFCLFERTRELALDSQSMYVCMRLATIENEMIVKLTSVSVCFVYKGHSSICCTSIGVKPHPSFEVFVKNVEQTECGTKYYVFQC
jgi:hypothetical protein